MRPLRGVIYVLLIETVVEKAMVERKKVEEDELSC
jgi:hypothetical protein